MMLMMEKGKQEPDRLINFLSAEIPQSGGRERELRGPQLVRTLFTKPDKRALPARRASLRSPGRPKTRADPRRGPDGLRTAAPRSPSLSRGARPTAEPRGGRERPEPRSAARLRGTADTRGRPPRHVPSRPVPSRPVPPRACSGPRLSRLCPAARAPPAQPCAGPDRTASFCPRPCAFERTSKPRLRYDGDQRRSCEHCYSGLLFRDGRSRPLSPRADGPAPSLGPEPEPGPGRGWRWGWQEGHLGPAAANSSAAGAGRRCSRDARRDLVGRTIYRSKNLPAGSSFLSFFFFSIFFLI